MRVQPYRISVADRALFKQCRRAWDLGAQSRRDLEPVGSPVAPKLDDALMEALAVYYFPGMWQWQRTIVLPLVHRALDQTLGTAAAGHQREIGHRLVDNYARWAAGHDAFIPIEVATDIEVDIPDPVLSDRGLATPDGEPVRFVTRLDALVFGDDNRPWVLCHRLVSGPFVDSEVLALDEEALTDCWAWRQFALDSRVAGVVFNEVRLDGGGFDEGGFRRTTVPVTAAELDLVGRDLALEAFDMLDAGLSLYPNPTAQNCGACPFRPPCRVIQEGHDATPLLTAHYRRRPPKPRQEGRLGGRTWSTNRGARPPHFGLSR